MNRIFYVLSIIKKEGNDPIGKLAMDTLDSSMMKKMATDSMIKGKNTGSTWNLND